MSEELNPCPWCHSTDSLQIHKVGWYFVKCHGCMKPGDSIIGQACPEEVDAVAKWQEGTLDGKLCSWR